MPEQARTVLAFDFGIKRIGVAVGEAELGTAHPLPGIAAPGFAAIEKLVKEWRPDALVVGLPVAERGEHPLARRVQRFARQLERENEILELVAQGKSNKELATALSIAANTVKNHLKNILEKLHLENRVQAATFAFRQGLLNHKPPNKKHG